MSWRLYRAALEALGLTEGQLKGRAARQQIERRRNDEGAWEYWTGSGEPTDASPPSSGRTSTTPEDIAAAYELDLGDPAWVNRGRYVYDGRRREFILQTPSAGGLTVWSLDHVCQIWAAYLSGLTQHEVCREFGIADNLWLDAKRALRLTRQRAPWPDEVLAEGDEGELEEDWLRQREQRLHTRVKRREWERIARDAERWRVGPGALVDALKGREIRPVQLPPLPPRAPRAPHLAALWLTDAHLGERAHGELGDLDAQIAWVGEQIARAASEALDAWGAPAGWVLPIGSDLFHHDNPAQGTTRGTPQGASSVGSAQQLAVRVADLMAGVIGHLAASAPVQCPWVPGNHDTHSSMWLALVLKAHFREVPRVQFDVGEARRKMILHQGVPFLFDHQDQVRWRDYPALLAVEAARAGATRIEHGAVFCGHLHRDQVEETVMGIRLIRSRALAHEGDWGAGQGFGQGEPAVPVYRLTERGVKGVVWS